MTVDEQVRTIAQSIRLTGGRSDDVLGTPDAPQIEDLTLEQYALAAMFCDPLVIRDHVAAGVLPTDWADARHAVLYAGIVTLWEAGKKVDAVTLYRQVARSQPTALEQEETLTYLLALVEGCFLVSVRHGHEWAALIHEMGMRRQLAGIGPAIAAAVYASPDLAGAIAEAQAIVARASRETGTRQSSPHFIDILADAETHTRGWPTPWDALNYYTGGLGAGQVWTVIGQTSHGKTALICNILLKAIRDGQRCAYFNLDSSNWAIVWRMVALEAGVDHKLAREGHRADTDLGRRIAAARSCFATGEYADAIKAYNTFRDLDRIVAEAKRHKAVYGLDVMVVDFLQNVTNGKGGGKESSAYDRTNSVISTLQHLSQVEEITVIVLSQVAIEQQKGGRDTAALNAKDSGSVKDMSDVSLAVWRDQFAMGEERTHLDVKVLKVKEGDVGVVKLEMDLPTGRISQRPLGVQSPAYQDWLNRP